MNKATLFKVALVACLTVAGFGLARPAEAVLHSCTESYCAANPNCGCQCVEGDGKRYICSQAPPICFA